jgi:N-methylhydantoinase B
MQAATETELDAISCEVAQHRLQMLAEEGGFRASRSAGSPFVLGLGSCASAIFKRNGEIVAQTLGGMMHVSAVREMMRAVIEDFPAETMREGDAFLCNDPFRGGIHPTDLGCFRPIFVDGELAYFSGMLMIVGDMGGVSSGGLPATATEVYHEGLVLPPVPIVEQGETSEGVMRVLMANSRVPTQLRTDIEALIGATAIVDQRLREMAARYGKTLLDEIIERLFDHSEAMVRAGLAAIPDGDYRGSYCAQEDGVGPAPSYEIKVRIAIDGDDCMFDFTGTARQAPGAINSSYSQSLSFITYAIRCYLDPEIPMNEGFYRPFRFELPFGTMVNPRSPAAANIRYSTGQAMIDAMHAALRPVFPQWSTAPSSALVSVNAQASMQASRPWAMLEVVFGPGGGRPGFDANDGSSFPMVGGGGYRAAVEAYETLFPVRYERIAFAPDTAGPGQWRGGAGVVADIRLLDDCTLTLRATDRTQILPEGVAGGGHGRGGGFYLNPGTAEQRRLPDKSTNHVAKGGTLLRLSVAGGGGWGDPLARDPALVAGDLRKGLITREGALADYGVVLDEAGEPDPAATAAARRAATGARA